MPPRQREPPKWTSVKSEVDWEQGQTHDLASQGFRASQTFNFTSNGAEPISSSKNNSGSCKRTRRAWQDKARSFQSLYTEHQGRVDACWEESAAICFCRAQVDALYTALVDTPIQDARLSVAGEQARIMARALAMKDVLVKQDSTVAEMLGVVVSGEQDRASSSPHSTDCCPPPPPSSSCYIPQIQPTQPQQTTPAALALDPCWQRAIPPPAAAAPTHTRSSSGHLPGTMPTSPDPALHRLNPVIQRSSNENEPDATAEECLLSVCLLLAALYEQTPFAESELRRRLFDDFTQLKRHFRHDELTVLHGRTGSIQELFDSIKDLDKHTGLQNLIGILFEDWKVNKRVDSFIMADQITVQVTALTPQGPIGKFVCKMRTFSTLSLLHQVLLKEMYHGMFVNKNPPRGQHEVMTAKDPMDFVDFVEAMARNMPYQRMSKAKGHLYYAWMYAPEANATAETWEQVFGHKSSAVPALHDEVKMPEGLVRHLDEDGDYSLDVEVAIQHDMREEGLSQTPLAFPWADDLLGEFLRRLKCERQKHSEPKQELKSEEGVKQQQQQRRRQPVVKQEELHPCVSGQQLQGSQQHGAANGHGGSQVMGSMGQNGCEAQGNGIVHNGSSSSSLQGDGTVGACEGVYSKGHLANGFHQGSNGAGPPPPSLQPQSDGNASNSTRPAPIANAEETGRLVLPLGIFLVGIICSGAHTNTQVHIEDLLLMSININMFGAPKVWWWVPQESVQEFKHYAESMTEGGRKELYTKSISPFLQDREENPPQPTLPLERLRAMGVKRTIQMPGMGILTMPGYAFHFTVSQGFNLAESCNMFLEVMGWTFDKLWKARPLEQYPNEVDDMARYMRDTGVLSRLGVADCLPEPPKRVHRGLKQHNLGHGKVVNSDGTKLQRYVTPDLVKYVSLPSKEKQEEECKRLIRERQAQQQPLLVII